MVQCSDEKVVCPDTMRVRVWWVNIQNSVLRGEEDFKTNKSEALGKESENWQEEADHNIDESEAKHPRLESECYWKRLQIIFVCIDSSRIEVLPG